MPKSQVLGTAEFQSICLPGNRPIKNRIKEAHLKREGWERTGKTRFRKDEQTFVVMDFIRPLDGSTLQQ